jgi:hypothetical protein
MHLSRFASTAERLVYRVAAFPVAIRLLFDQTFGDGADPLRAAFVNSYWHPDGAGEWSELALGLLLWPLAMLVASAWFTWRNGAEIRRRHNKPLATQLREQLKLYFSAGVFPPWYYIFSLHEDGRRRAPSFIQRFETKTCYFRLLKRREGTPLNDKRRFAEYCARRGIRCVETLMSLDGTLPPRPLPECDIFVKPTCGRGGRGAERWDHVGPATFASPDGARRSSEELLRRLVERSRHRPLIVQPRLRPHSGLRDFTAGALPTVRVLTCLDREGRPEVVAAMMRTSVGSNKTVDNLHAGGIGALVDIRSGALSKASDLGSDASLGWFSAHPDTRAPIEGRIVPCWSEAKAAAVAAHRHFNDRVVVGWDIAILDDGPIIVEGNGNPDLDILQRFMRTGLREHRFGKLLAYHLRARREARPERSGLIAD